MLCSLPSRTKVLKSRARINPASLKIFSQLFLQYNSKVFGTVLNNKKQKAEEASLFNIFRLFTYLFIGVLRMN